MPGIPSNPNLIRNAKPPVKQNTGTGDNITPKAVFALPYQGGEAAMNMVDNISKFANNVADEDAKNKAFQEGKDRETAANKAGTTTISNELLPSWTISGKAFEEGQNIAFLTHQELKINETLFNLKEKEKNNRNVENFLLDTAEFEKDFLTELPEKMQSAVYLAYQKKKQVFEQEIRGNMLNDQRSVSLNEGKTLVSQKVNSLYSAIVSNVDSGIIMNLFVEARNEIEQKFAKLGVTQQAINVEIDAFRLQIFEALLMHDWDAADVKEKDILEKEINSGAWKGSLDTQDITKYFPKGMELTGTEREHLKIVLTKLKTGHTKAHENMLKTAKDESTKAINSNKDGSKIFELYVHDTNDIDNSSYRAYKSENDKYRIRKDLEIGGATQTELEQFDQEWEESVKIGTAAVQGYLLGRGTTKANHMANEFKVAIEQAELITVGDGDGQFKSDTQKSNHIRLLKDQEKAFNLSQKTLTEHLEKGGNQATALIEAGVINFEKKDYNEAGINQLKEDVARMLNIQIDTVNIIPMQLVNDYKGRINQATNGVEFNQYFEEAIQLYGKNNAFQIFQKLTAKSDEVTDDATLALFGIYKPNKIDKDGNTIGIFANHLSETAAMAVKTYDENIANLEGYIQLGDTATDRAKQFKALVLEEFVAGEFQYLGPTLGTVQGQSYKALYEVMFANYLRTTRGDIERAKILTIEFFDETHFKGEIAEGVTILASRNDIPGEGAIWEKYKETYAQVKKDPLAFGAVSARFDTVHEIEDDFTNFYVSFANESMTFYDESGRPVMLSHMGQDGASMYSEFTITPFSLRKGNVAIDQQLQNQADDIEYTHSDFTKNFKELREESIISSTQIGNVEYIDIRAKTIREKAAEATKLFRTTVDADPKDHDTFEYLKKNDFAIGELTHNEQEQDTLTMIGHAVSTGQTEPWMLEWIGANIPYGKNVQFKENIDKVMEIIKDPNNYERFKNGLTDKGDTGSIQTPMQYLFSIIRETTFEGVYSYEKGRGYVDEDFQLGGG